MSDANLDAGSKVFPTTIFNKVKLMAESILGCCGYFGAPIAPNGPCPSCPSKDLCQYITAHFAPKKLVRQKIEQLQAMTRERT